MNSHAHRDTPWIRAYERLWPDPIPDNDPRREAIAQEMRELRAARSLREGLRVIGWWYSHGGLSDAERDGEIRRAMRRLKTSKRLARAMAEDPQVEPGPRS